jgi:DUF3040 family protein
MMPLSSHEQRILESIEQECRLKDPAFVAKFEAPVVQKRGRWRRIFRRPRGKSEA